MNKDELLYTTVGTPQTRAARWPAQSVNLSARVVAVGAWCSNRSAHEPRPERNYLSIQIDEFAELSDGTRVSIRWDRGVTVSWDSENANEHLSGQEVFIHLEGGLLPDEGEAADEGQTRSWHEYARLLTEMGVAATADELKSLPYFTEFSPELQASLSH